MAKLRLASFYRQPIRSIADSCSASSNFVLLPTLVLYRPDLRTFTDQIGEQFA
jgi:hypothetical protein